MGDAFQLKYPKKVRLGDITVRDGFQHEEIWIPTEAKLFYAGRDQGIPGVDEHSVRGWARWDDLEG
jgi:hypothetical protein